MGKIFFFGGGWLWSRADCLRKLTYPKPREKRRLDGNFNYTGTQSFITTSAQKLWVINFDLLVPNY